MARTLAETVSAPRGAGEIVAGAFEEALTTSPEIEQARRFDVATDQFAISPYRKWLGSLVGGKVGKFVSDLNNAEIDMDNQREAVKKLTDQIRKGITVVKPVSTGLFAKQIPSAGGFADIQAYAKSIGAKLSQKNMDDMNKVKAKKGQIYADTGFKKIIEDIAKSVGKTLEDKVSAQEALQEAQDKFTSARTKFNKAIKKFNDVVPKKSELEQMAGLSLQQLKTAFRSGRSDPTERMMKSLLYKELTDAIDKLSGSRGFLAIKKVTPAGKIGEVQGRLDGILQTLKNRADLIITSPISLERAHLIASPIRSALSQYSDIEKEKAFRPKNFWNWWKFWKPKTETRLAKPSEEGELFVPERTTEEIFPTQPAGVKRTQLK